MNLPVIWWVVLLLVAVQVALYWRRAGSFVWALATWIENAHTESVDALLWFAFEDGWSIWLDGEEVSHALRIGTPILEDTIVPARLAPGRHLLLVLLEDAGGAAAFSARLTLPDGSAASGLRTASEPRE